MQTIETIAQRILVLRGQRVILDFELAALYGVETRTLLQSVRRNAGRFPMDFMFTLANHEVTALRSQFVISKPTGRGGRRYATHAFTEHGAIMAATVINSSRAIDVSLYVVRAFVSLRKTLAANKELANRLDDLERRVGTHDAAIGEILAAIRQLAAPPEPAGKRRIGFVQD